MRERIGTLGGAFNPPHFGHIRPALAAKELLRLDRLLFLPSGHHPFKADARLAPAHHRLAMTRLALAGAPGCAVSDLEANREGVSYTIDTLELLRERHPEAELFFLFGSDLLAELHLWRSWQELIHTAHLCVLPRPGYEAALDTTEAARYLAAYQVQDLADLDQQRLGRWGYAVLPTPFLAASSTEVRGLLGTNNASAATLLPETVWRYIKEHRLYTGETDEC